MTEPDWDTIHALQAEIRQLRDDKKWTAEEYDRILPLAKKAVGSSFFLIESFQLQRAFLS